MHKRIDDMDAFLREQPAPLAEPGELRIRRLIEKSWYTRINLPRNLSPACRKQIRRLTL